MHLLLVTKVNDFFFISGSDSVSARRTKRPGECQKRFGQADQNAGVRLETRKVCFDILNAMVLNPVIWDKATAS